MNHLKVYEALLNHPSKRYNISFTDNNHHFTFTTDGLYNVLSILLIHPNATDIIISDWINPLHQDF